jgi:hypothetical protein
VITIVNLDWLGKKIRVRYHVGGRKVTHDEIMLGLPHELSNFIGDAMHAHFGVLIVSSDFGRRDHVPFFAFELLFNASVEEECDVGIFLRFLRQMS